jgi:hypothetical protein
MMPSPNRVPDWLLERLAAGELPPNQASSLRQRLAEAGQTDRLDALIASNAQVLQAYPADQVAAEVQRRAKRAEASRNRGWTRPVWAMSLAAAGAAAVVVVMHKPDSTPGPVAQLEPEITRDKGEKPAPSLGLYRQQSSGVEPLGPSSRLHAGDLVQVRYLAAGRPYGVVASMDARGSVTLHLPETPGPAVALAGEGERALAHAYELDDSPGFERFVFVTADAPFDTGLVVRALKQGAALPKGFTLWSVTLAKDPR